MKKRIFALVALALLTCIAEAGMPSQHFALQRRAPQAPTESQAGPGVAVGASSVPPAPAGFESAERKERRTRELAAAQRKPDDEWERYRRHMLASRCPANEDSAWAQLRAEMPDLDEARFRKAWAGSKEGARCIKLGFKP